MITPVSSRPLFTLLIAVVALALPSVLSAQSGASTVSSNSKKTHTITIHYADGGWHYSIYPAQADAKKAKVKRGDTLNWVCADGGWEVFFKNGVTPLVNGNGDPEFTVNGGSGAANGASIGVKHKDGDTFTYGVRVHPNGGGGPVVDDPEIIIES